MADILNARHYIKYGKNEDLREALAALPVGVIGWMEFDGLSLLHLAAKYGNLEAAQLILQKRALLETPAPGSNGYTALHFAARGGQVQICALLLEHGANINSLADDKSTPLHAAALEGQLEAVRFLVEKGAALNTGNSMGETPLHHAASKNQVEIARVLIQAGADPHLRDRCGYTPAAVASIYHYPQMAELLDAGPNRDDLPNRAGPLLLLAARQAGILKAELTVNPELTDALDGMAAELLRLVIARPGPLGVDYHLVAGGFSYAAAKGIEAAHSWKNSPEGRGLIAVDADDFLAGRVGAQVSPEVSEQINSYNAGYSRQLFQVFADEVAREGEYYQLHLYGELKTCFLHAALIAASHTRPEPEPPAASLKKKLFGWF